MCINEMQKSLMFGVFAPNIQVVYKFAKEFKIDVDWKLRAQMPFGVPAGESGEKTFEPLEERMLFLK